ncbi:hypothetical protein ACFSQ7_38500 [Paenibacillus rhizoplanae]
MFIGFAHHSARMGNIVKELSGQPSQDKPGYHIVLIEQERYHPYWEMVEKGGGGGSSEIRDRDRIHGPGAQ